LLGAQGRIFDDRGYGTVVLTHNASVTRGIFNFSGKYRGGGAAFAVRPRQCGNRFGANQRGVARQQNHEFSARRNGASRHEHGVPGPALRLL
jgi:hypothetical protein